MGRWFRIVTSIVCCITLSAILLGQMRVDVQLVNIVATVTDEAGRYVPGLKASDFSVEEDGIPQKIVHFSQDNDIPVSVGVVLDTSGSMERKLRTAVDAVNRFLRKIHEEDEIFIETFSSQPQLRQDFTSDRETLLNSLRKVRATGGTALYDALTEALDKIESARHDKRAILLITDGQDTSSASPLDEVLGMIRESELLVYSLGISPTTYGQRSEHVPFSWPLPGILSNKQPASSRRDEVDMKVLRDFAESSGGRAFLLGESWLGGRGAEIERILNQVADELRSQYTLGYYPSRIDDGKYHSIRVRVSGGRTVRARSGYLARSS